jgi:lipoate-protein ligase A
MRFIHNNNISNPRINLAFEEYCLRNLNASEDYVLFYVNAPSVIIGKHQNPFEECNRIYLQEKNIHLVRRISGGGAVYHDDGNLNFSFITSFEKGKLDYVKILIRPIVKALCRLGVPAEITEKNNILVEGKKVSGNSQYTNIKRLLSHGTLLIDSDLEALRSALKSNTQVIHSKAVQSVRSDVVNISDVAGQTGNMKVYRDEVMAALSERFGKLNHLHLSGGDWDTIYALAQDKYTSWEWTFGRSPDFAVRHHIRCGADQVECELQVKRGIIQQITVQDRTPQDPAINDLKAKYLNRRYDTALKYSHTCNAKENQEHR